MVRRLLLILMPIFIIILVLTIYAKSKSILVLSTIRFDNETSGVIFPEIAIDADGNWREATIKDMWIGQKFKIFDRTLEPKVIGETKVDTFRNDFALFKETKKNRVNSYYWGIFSTEKRFKYNKINKIIKPENISDQAQLEFTRNDNLKNILQQVVKDDWENIKKDFPKIISSNVADFMIGDINGDKIPDYVLVLNNISEKVGAAVVVYLKNGLKYQRIPVEFWKNASYQTSWPRLFFMKDFNGDNAEEFVITDSDSDINIPIIYSWFEDEGGLMEVYHGKVEFTN